MTNDPPDGSVQETPTGVEIPVPTRRELFENLTKVAPPVEPAKDASNVEDPQGPAES